jgi:hypothetical protein
MRDEHGIRLRNDIRYLYAPVTAVSAIEFTRREAQTVRDREVAENPAHA